MGQIISKRNLKLKKSVSVSTQTQEASVEASAEDIAEASAPITEKGLLHLQDEYIDAYDIVLQHNL